MLEFISVFIPVFYCNYANIKHSENFIFDKVNSKSKIRNSKSKITPTLNIRNPKSKITPKSKFRNPKSKQWKYTTTPK